ncbi:hypothetical protein BDM02DRAFT_3105019, partial [Thelephora ganbajun]
WPWAVLTGDVWVEHGKTVADAGRFLSRSFDRVPRNPQEKISSGYKAWEFLVYVYILGPGLFYGVLPEPYYRHFCKLIQGIRLIYQRSISREQLRIAHQTLLKYCVEFEHLYYQRRSNRLHFVRQSIHSLTHLGPKTHRLGPLLLSAQWTMERIIGVLGSLVKQPSNAFANLTEQAKKMANINALLAMWPEIGHKSHDPRGSFNLGGGYILLGPKDDKPYILSPAEQHTLTSSCFLDPGAPMVRSVYQWGRLQISNGQLARLCWKEIDCSRKLAQTDQILKVSFDLILSMICFAEARFYFCLGSDARKTLALVSLFSMPDEAILQHTHGVLTVCEYQDEASLAVIEIKSIQVVVGMVPFGKRVEGHNPRYFLAEKLGLDVYNPYSTGSEDADDEV